MKHERIFFSISDEDRAFVHLVLKWIYYNDMLSSRFSCSLVIQAIQHSMQGSDSPANDYFYDKERLCELCGCLIAIPPAQDESDQIADADLDTVSFAHYTVLEFLQSPRILSGPARFFAVQREKTLLELIGSFSSR